MPSSSKDSHRDKDRDSQKDKKDKDSEKEVEVKRVCITKVTDPHLEDRLYEKDDTEEEEDDVSSEEEEEEESEDDDDEDDISITSSFVLKNDVLHFVLSKFFVTEDKKNIATVLEEINESLKKLVSLQKHSKH
jgi:hypothetical protein